MGLSGLQIYKYLPKENCKECGLPTCLAFAMKVAGGQASLESCPRLSDAARAELGEAGAPPQQLVKIGTGDKAVEIGQETVLYRHEEKFYHPTAVAICMNDQLDPAALAQRCKAVDALCFDRMGKKMSVDLLALNNVSGEPDRFAEAARVAATASRKPLVLISAEPAALRAAGVAVAADRPLLWATNASERAQDVIAIAKELGLPLCLQAPGFEPLVAVASKAREAGLRELILSPGHGEAASGLELLSQSRRAAITKKFRPMGYPVAMMAMAEEPAQAAVEACWYILKYAGIVVTNVTQPEYVLSIMTARQDIYTDPQIPVQVTPGLHTVGEPGPQSPILVTTNFALSYYSVESEVESARVPVYIVAVDTEGTSVLTAWAADKFTASSIAAALTKSGVQEKVSHHKVIIPGLVAVLSAALKDESGWDVHVGPKEASGIVSFIKNQWKP
jgi:acetyl-CoA decarbonylase/synthase complex subunit gamma